MAPAQKDRLIGSSDNPLTNPPSTEREKKRLNLDLSLEAYDLLQEIATESGKSMADVLRTGLALYGIAQEESHKGNSLAIADREDKIVKQIVAI